MKTELKSVPHSIRAGETTTEIWHDGKFIGSIYANEGRSIQIITKYKVTTTKTGPTVTKITIEETLDVGG